MKRILEFLVENKIYKFSLDSQNVNKTSEKQNLPNLPEQNES